MIKPWDYIVCMAFIILAISSFVPCLHVSATDNQFREWNIPTANSIPIDIAVYEGQVYFTEYRGNKIGRLDPSSGTITEWHR
jgi:streptogramin lyase